MSIAGHQEIMDLLDKYGAIAIATAPLAATIGARLIFGKSRWVTATMRVSAGWLAARAFLSPHIGQMHDTLTSLVSLIHNNGYN